MPISEALKIGLDQHFGKKNEGKIHYWQGSELDDITVFSLSHANTSLMFSFKWELSFKSRYLNVG